MSNNPVDLPSEQVEKLKEIGNKLREYRQEKSISLEEVAAKTQIRLSLLKAIEEGKIEKLPEPVYIKGFIKQFAEAIGLNGNEIAISFPVSTTSMWVKPSWLHLSTARLRPIHLYVLYICLVIGAVNYLSYLLDRSLAPVSSDSSIDRRVLPQSTQVKIEELTPVKSNQTERLLKATQPLRVDVTLKSSSWIRVVVDGKTKFEGTLKSGEQRTWVANKQLTVIAGNAGGVMLALNDGKARQLGKPGQSREVTFEKNRRS
jgi:cytoskeletal protein RodZ